MDHLIVTHGTVTNVRCNGCGVSWDVPTGPMVIHLDHFATLHARCAVSRRGIDAGQTASSMR